ncbi:MAG: AmmeMemoRadiSam system protein A [Myxococcota bacterium]|nr:AmmeMemoRadiSam system protein A [Myxococcota bacterium]MDW8361205.1 AmmeMemoRadiSam system protein A [Myxococcales bacterium]
MTSPYRSELLALARRAVRAAAENAPAPRADPSRLEAWMREPGCCFVTLRTLDGRLRGCIGRLEPDLPLHECVVQSAIAAASRDPRFEPVRPDEVDALRIEIHVLGPTRRVHGPSEVEVGRHGVVLRAAGRRGVLLPSVAVEHGLDATRFVEAVCHKAGLPVDAWRRSDAVLEVFETLSFAEPECGAVDAGG